MPFKKGHNKIGGRKREVKNKINKSLREMLQQKAPDLLKSALKVCQEDPANSQALIGKLLDKVLPTLNKNENTNENITIYDETLERIIQQVKEINKQSVNKELVES